MDKTVVAFIREQIKKGLAQLEDTHRLRFNRMYSHENLEKPVNDVVDTIPEEKLNWALTQVENSLLKPYNANKEKK